MLPKTAAFLCHRNLESAVSALLLKKQGFILVCMSVHDPSSKYFDELNDEYTEYISKKLELPWHVHNVKESSWIMFKREIVEVLKNGRNPDINILYNKLISFGDVFQHVSDDIGTSVFGTSHYARRDAGLRMDDVQVKGVKLLKAVDQTADESFSLSQVRQKTLQQTVFPMGEFTTEVAKKIASSVGFHAPAQVSEKNVIKVQDILNNSEIPKLTGIIMDLDWRTELQKHKGMHKYEVGQCIHIHGKEYYVAEKDHHTGNVNVVSDPQHPALFTRYFLTGLAHWSHTTPHDFYSSKQMMDVNYRTKLGEALKKCTLTVGNVNEYCGNDHLILSSLHPMKAVVCGHYCAFYKGEELLGSAEILRPGPSDYTMNYHTINKSKNTSKTPFRAWLQKLGMDSVKLG